MNTEKAGFFFGPFSLVLFFNLRNLLFRASEKVASLKKTNLEMRFTRNLNNFSLKIFSRISLANSKRHKPNKIHFLKWGVLITQKGEKNWILKKRGVTTIFKTLPLIF
ncbi:MAG: hypothetical protein H0A75_02575 [Candidatus Methanofishera endochildressiae]|uniref:Uncharacterized protein n=1 Tax=Candidatus Methanofishera endochildressiae TaxID=2738884 RepID=A0A7Z0MN05_9GAMM|nr:hypothetical protein [Candidatus Methanofishera endochildressiae]